MRSFTLDLAEFARICVLTRAFVMDLEKKKLCGKLPALAKFLTKLPALAEFLKRHPEHAYLGDYLKNLLL